MKKKILFTIPLLLLLMFVSCAHEETPSTRINFDDAKDSKVQELFSKVKLVSLKDNGKTFLPDVSALDVYDDYMLVSDKHSILYLFSRDGNCISNSKDKFGHGQGEYSIITAYTFNPYSKSIEIVTPTDLLIFDIHFKLQKKIPVPTKFSSTGEGFVFFGKIYDLSASTHLLIPTGISEDCHRICVFDSEKREIVKTLSYGEDVIANATMQAGCFFPIQDNSLLFCPPCITNYIYSFDKNSLTLNKLYYTDFGNNGLSASDVNQFGNNIEREKEFLLKCEKSMPAKTMYANNCILFTVKESNHIRKWHTLIYNMNTQELSSIKNYSDKGIQFPIILSVNKNSMYSAVETRQLQSLLEPFGENVDKTDFDSNSEENDYAIVEYIIR